MQLLVEAPAVLDLAGTEAAGMFHEICLQVGPKRPGKTSLFSFNYNTFHVPFFNILSKHDTLDCVSAFSACRLKATTTTTTSSTAQMLGFWEMTFR